MFKKYVTKSLILKKTHIIDDKNAHIVDKKNPKLILHLIL